MAPAELHYSRARLAWLLGLGVLFAGLFLWLGLDAAAIADGRGRAARFAQAIGPGALRVVAFGLAALCLAFSLLYLRLLFAADRLAARADVAGLTLRTAFGTRAFRWPEVRAVFLRRVPTPGGGQRLVMLRPMAGRDRGIAANALVEREHELEAWIEAAERLRIASAEGRESG